MSRLTGNLIKTQERMIKMSPKHHHNKKVYYAAAYYKLLLSSSSPNNTSKEKDCNCPPTITTPPSNNFRTPHTPPIDPNTPPQSMTQRFPNPS